MANQVKVIVHSSEEVLDEILLVDGQVVNIPAQGGVTYEIKELTEEVAPEEVVVKRKGDDLELYLSPDSETPDAVIPDYYLLEDPSPLVGLAEDGQFYSYVPQSGDASLLPWNMEEGDSSYQSLGHDTVGSEVPWWPILLAGLLVGGGIAAASSSSSSGGGGAVDDSTDNEAPLPPGNLEVSKDGTTVTGTGEPGTSVEVTDPDGDVIGGGTVDENGDFEVEIDPPQTDGEDLDVTLEDDSGNTSDPGTVTAPDTTAPDAPVIDSNDGVTITGTGEAGTTVTITGPEGETLGTGTVDENGDFTVDLNPAQSNGEELEATLTDKAGNESAPTQTIAPDTTAPEAPGDLVVSEDGTTVTGTGEPGAKVEVTDPDDKVIGDGTVDENGDFKVDVTPPQTDGEDLDVTLEDDSGNTSDPGTVTAPDTTAPDAPVIDSNDGVTITGTGEAGTTVTITGPEGETLGTGTVDENGDFTVDLNPEQSNGEELEATLTDAAGNESAPTQTVAPDSTAPEAPGDLVVSEDGTTVTGTGEPGAKVEVTDPDDKVIGDGTVDENGDFKVDVTPPQTDGEDLDVTLEDDSGNTSDPGTVTAPDTTAPDAPVIDSNDGVTITGTGEAGTTVTITGPEGETLGTGTVDENGDFTVDLNPAQSNGEELEATLTDKAGNESAPTQTVAPDTTAPGAPIVTLGNGDEFITDDEITGGNVTVTVKLPDDAVTGDMVHGLDKDVVLSEADITNGEIQGSVAAPGEGETLDVSVTVTDVAGNTGPAGTASATVDTTAPDGSTTQVKIDDITDDNTINKAESEGQVEITGKVTGEFTEGDEVTVTVNGVDTTGIVAADGTFSVMVEGSDLAQDADETVEVTVAATDEAGNVGSATASKDYLVDTVAPSAPTVELGDGDELISAEEISSGKVVVTVTLPGDAVAGDTVQGLDNDIVLTEAGIAAGKVTGTVDAPADGKELNVSVTITDVAGNKSDPGKASATVDTTSPGGEDGTDAPVLTIAEADDNYINADELSDGIRAAVSLTPGTQEGDTLVVTLTDSAGDEHEFTHTVTAGDLTATEVDMTLTGPFPEGDTSTVAVITDDAGNRSADSNDVSFTIDTLAPEAPTAELAEDTGATDGVTSNGQVTVGNLEQDATWEYSTDGGSTWSDGSGTSFELPEGEYADGDVVVRQTDEAGNTSPSGELGAVTVDTTAPDSSTTKVTVDDITDDNTINKAETEGQVEVTGSVTGEFTEGDEVTVTVNGVDTIGIVAADGTFSVTVEGSDLAQDADETVEVTVAATDEAGNVGSATASKDYLVDTVAPSAPTVELGDGDEFISAEEVTNGKVTVTVKLPGDAVAGDTVQGLDDDIVLTEADITNGEVRGTVAAPGHNEKLDVSVTITDVAGNKSDPGTASATVDTKAPDGDTTTVTVNDITDDNTINKSESEGQVEITGKVTGEFTEGDEVTVTVNGTKTTGTVAADGTFSITVEGSDLANDSDETVDVTVAATDEAGNVGSVTTTKNYDVTANELIAAADNFVDFQLTADPLRTENPNPEELNDTGFTLVGAGLGPVLGAGVVDNVVENSVQLTVGADQVREITLYADAGGVTIGTMNLNLYKKNEATQEWELQSVEENWLTAVLGGKSDDTDFTLGEGEWMFAMSGNLGLAVATGYTLRFKKDVVLDYANAESMSGSVSGNILNDDDNNYSYDELPSGTTLTSVNGVQVAETGDTVIEGEHGTLTVKANGTYSYEINPDFRGPYGEEEVFTYEVTSPSGNTVSADLTIQLNINPVEEQKKVDENLVIDIEPTVILDTTDSEIDDAVGFGVLDLSFGSSSVLDLELLGGKPPLEFTVGENQVRELTLHGSGGGVDIAKTYSMAVYKLNESTGNYEQVHLEKNWFNVPLLGGKSDPLTLQFGEGDYKAVLLAAGGVGVLSGNGLYVDNDKIYDYSNPSTIEGTQEGDVTPDAGTTLVKVGDELIDQSSTEAITVQGTYGELEIYADGTYTYTLTELNDTAYGKVDSFRLVTQDADGKAAVETLNIKVSTHKAVDDFDDVTVELQNLETTEKVIDGVSAATSELTKEFTVAENTVTSATLKVDTTTLGTRLEYSITDSNGNVVAANTDDATRSLDVTIDNLAPGDYTLEIKRVSGGGHLRINGSDFTIESTHLDKYTPTDTGPESTSGALIQNDQGVNNIAELKVGNKSVFVSDPNKGADSIEIEGLYGTLTVDKSGNYSYQPNGEDFGIETFTYETISVVGTKETATLEINVGKTITASEHADMAVSSAADDVFTMGEGADTLTYENLGFEDDGGNGNNGLDTWTDFNAGQGDTINVSALLDGNQTADNIGDYLKFEGETLMVDRNGMSDGEEQFEELLDLSGSGVSSLENVEWEANTPEGFSLSSLVDTSESLSFEGEPVAGAGAAQPTPMADTYTPLAEPTRQEDDDSAAAASVV